jgi:uncharacterized membrane protein (UPF0127 family)
VALLVLAVGAAGACASADTGGRGTGRPGASPADAGPGEFATESVELVQTQRSREICLLVADTPDLRRAGLSGREDLDGYAGMLFEFEEAGEHSFWMSETLVPLDLLPVDATGTVIAVIPMEPCPDGVDCRTYSPGVSYDLAVELAGGDLASWGLDPNAGPISVRRSGQPCDPSSEGG